jgi:hypothetical protein
MSLMRDVAAAGAIMPGASKATARARRPPVRKSRLIECCNMVFLRHGLIALLDGTTQLSCQAQAKYKLLL